MDNDEVKFSEVVEFEWDTAYVDYETYGYGNDIKEKYGITGEFQEIIADYCYRIAYCKDGVLVADLILSTTGTFAIEIDKSVEIIYPDTMFNIERQTYNENGIMKIHLTINSPKH